MKQKYKILILAAAVLAMVGVLAWLFLPNEQEKKSPSDSISLNLPEGEAAEIESSKSESYKKQWGKKNNYDDYFDSLVSDDEKNKDNDISLVSSDNAAAIKPENNSKDKIVDVLGLENAQEPPAKPAPKPRSGGGGGSKTRQSTSSTSSASTNNASSDEKFVQDMERARAIAEAMGMSDSGTPAPVKETDSRIEIKDNGPRQSGGGIISSLDDWDDSISSFEDSGDYPVKCMFIKDEKIKSGQRVTIRTLQDFFCNGMLVPANTHLTAVCSISNRLSLNVASIEIGGKIIQLDYDAYDFDGSKGIYCPETTSSKGARSATSQAVSQGSTMLGSYVGTIANAVVRTGASIFQTASGETGVCITNGYEFYLMKHRR